MPVISYTATRSLRAGVTEGDAEQIETKFQQRPRTHRKEGYRQRALSGDVSSYLDRIDYERALVTDFLYVSSAMDQWREFLDSVANSETFQIDFTGTIASPGTDVNVEMLSNEVVEDLQNGLVFLVRFVVREV